MQSDPSRRGSGEVTEAKPARRSRQDARKAWWASMTPEERERRMTLLREGRKRWDAHTAELREKEAAKQKALQVQTAPRFARKFKLPGQFIGSDEASRQLVEQREKQLDKSTELAFDVALMLWGNLDDALASVKATAEEVYEDRRYKIMCQQMSQRGGGSYVSQ